VCKTCATYPKWISSRTAGGKRPKGDLAKPASYENSPVVKMMTMLVVVVVS